MGMCARSDGGAAVSFIKGSGGVSILGEVVGPPTRWQKYFYIRGNRVLLLERVASYITGCYTIPSRNR